MEVSSTCNEKIVIRKQEREYIYKVFVESKSGQCLVLVFLK